MTTILIPQVPIQMIQGTPDVIPRLPPHLVTDEQKINHLIRQIKSYETLFKSQQEYIFFLQRNHSSIQSQELSAQLEVNQTLTEYILELEAKIDATKQRNN